MNSTPNDPAFNQSDQQAVPVPELIIQMEKAALERWNQGDPSGFLEITAPDVVYFDPVQHLEGLEKLTALYETARGMIQVDQYEMLNPRVIAAEKMAALSYQLISRTGTSTQKWNCTEVYRLENDRKWRIVQTHWSVSGGEI